MDRFKVEAGATVVEYGFLLAGIAIVVAVTLPMLAQAVASLYASASDLF